MFIYPSAGGHLELWEYTWTFLTLTERLHSAPVSPPHALLPCLTGHSHYLDLIAYTALWLAG